MRISCTVAGADGTDAEWVLTEAAWSSGECRVWSLPADVLEGWRRGGPSDVDRYSGSQLITDPESDTIFITKIGGQTRLLDRQNGGLIAVKEHEYQLDRQPGLGPCGIGSWYCDPEDGRIEYTLVITAVPRGPGILSAAIPLREPANDCSLRIEPQVFIRSLGRYQRRVRDMGDESCWRQFWSAPQRPWEESLGSPHIDSGLCEERPHRFRRQSVGGVHRVLGQPFSRR